MKQTPLHVAVEAGHKDIVKVFLDFKGILHYLFILITIFHTKQIAMMGMCCNKKIMIG